MNYAEKYKALPFEHIISRFRSEKTLEYVYELNLDTWVEIGCGDLPLAISGSKFRWIVVEPDQGFRNIACKNRNVIAYKDILDVPVHNNRVGIVINSLLHELSDPLLLLQRVKDTFPCDQNKLIVNVPNGDSLHRIYSERTNANFSRYSLSKTGLHLSQQRVFSVDSLKKS